LQILVPNFGVLKVFFFQRSKVQHWTMESLLPSFGTLTNIFLSTFQSSINYNSWFLWLGFLIKKKYPKMIGVKRTTLSIWTSWFVHVQCDWVVKLDLIILTSRTIDKMTNYLTIYLIAG
jgi:hypothetical protein